MTSLGQRPTWHWEKPDPRVSGTSGDLAKLFRNESVKHPGALARDAPSPLATVMAREVIQNAWDAAGDLRSTWTGGSPPEFEIHFTFRSCVGKEKAELVKALALKDLRLRARSGDRRVLGLGSDDCLEHIDDDAPLRILEISESGASGMYGRFDNAQSKLFLALAGLGYTAKHEGAGGSFGFGKAGLIRGSAVHAVLAYTCFQERIDDPGVTRRLLAMAYWGQHQYRSDPFTGFARFGENRDGWQQPLENEVADSFAASIGIAQRSSQRESELGTTLVLIDPTVEAADLCSAIERNWWPALIDSAFVVTVTSADGVRSVPRPRKNRTLAPFVRAYELALTPQDNLIDNEYSRSLGTTRAVSGSDLRVGAIGLVADLEGWSYAADPENDDDGTPERSLVALVRGPRMVVEYLDVGGHVPHVRGAFVADPDVDELLRQSEPKAHDSWQTAVGEEGIDPLAPKVASSVLHKVRTSVREFKRRLRPPARAEEDIQLPVLQGLMRRLLAGASTGDAALLKRSPFVTTVEQRLLASDVPELVVAQASVTVSPEPNLVPIAESIVVELAYRYIENGKGGSAVKLDIVPPEGFRRDERSADAYLFVGVLSADPVRFTVTTESYSREWTGRLSVGARKSSEGDVRS